VILGVILGLTGRPGAHSGRGAGHIAREIG